MFHQFYVLPLDPIEIKTYSAPQNDGLDFSFVKDFYVVGDKMTRMVKKLSFISHKFSKNFLPKLKIKGLRNICVLCCSFLSN